MKQKEFEKKMHGMYDEIETRFRPDLRWWLAEGLNTDATLRKNVQQIYDSGFGAAEFLAMPEPSADSSIYGWGSEEWTSDTRLIIDEATRLGLGFSLTSGSHWATANLPDTYVWDGRPYNPDNKAASKELDYATIRLKAGEAHTGVLPYPVRIAAIAGDIHGSAATYTEYVFQGVVAAKLLKAREESGQDYGYAEGVGTGVLDAESLVDLSAKVQEKDGIYSLDWTAPEDGEYVLFVYWMHGTGQTASPSVSTNYTINYMDRYGIEALIDYWEEVVLTDELKKTIRKNGRGEIYMDSLELLSYGAGGIFWGYDFKQEFINRRGYDLTKYLPLITMDKARVTAKCPKEYDYTAPDADELIQKVRTDFYSVMSEMYVENVLSPLQSWLHSLGMTLRAEPSYGVNFEISTPAKAIDGIETESFAQTADVDLYRGLSGSANMYGRIFSSETGAVFGHNYYYNMDTWTCLCFLQFSEGVNRTVFHGYSAIEGSEGDTYWPGHEGMYAKFSERFNSRQPASLHYPEWTRMLGRVQKAMRQGKALRDLAILRTDYFFVNYGKPKEHVDFEHGYMMYDMAYFWKDLSLQQAGYTYDYFSPLLLEDESNVRWSDKALQPDGPAYKAMIIYQEDIELSCAKKILEIAKDGLPVLFVNHNGETITHEGPEIMHGKAASRSKYWMDSDADVQAIVSAIKALPNVTEVESPAEALEALQQMGVYPRVAYAEPNNKILTASRLDREERIMYTFAYSYKFAVEKDAPATTFTLELEGEGTPYMLDVWSGDVERIGTYTVQNGRTSIEMTLKSGEGRLILLDLSEKEELPHAVSTTAADVMIEDGEVYMVAEESGSYETVLNGGHTVKNTVEVPDPMPLDVWNIEIEDWNAGRRVVNTEEKFGHVTKEVYYRTKKTKLKFHASSLAAWKDLPATEDQLRMLAGRKPSMAHVSGIGTYETGFLLEDGWENAYLQVESVGGGTAMVWINDQKVGLIPARTLKLDVSKYIRKGLNTIRIEVASTLTNRMLQRGYQDKRSGWTETFPTVQDYGLMGKVRLVPYVKTKIG